MRQISEAQTSPDPQHLTRTELLAQVVDARLVELFEGIALTCEKTRADGERELVLHMLTCEAESVDKWITSTVESGEPPIKYIETYLSANPEVDDAYYAEYAESETAAHSDRSRGMPASADKRRPVVAFVPEGRPRGVNDFPSARPVGVWELDAAAGGGAVNLDNAPLTGYAWFRHDWLDRHGLESTQCAVIRVRGESMEPTLPGGCSILIARDRQDLRAGDIYVVSTSDGLVVKRAKREGNRWFLTSESSGVGVSAVARWGANYRRGGVDVADAS